MALGIAGKHPALIGVRPEGQEPGPQLLIDVDRLKARALGIDIANLNDTLQSVLGVAYINDFVREGRILRVQMQAEPRTRSTPEQIMQIPIRNTQGGMVPLSEFAKAKWVVDSPKLDRYNGLPAMKIAGSPRTGPQQRRRLEGNGRSCVPIAARFRFRMVRHFQRRTAFRQSGTVPVRPVGDRRIPVSGRAV